jgi:outer membrane protein
VPNAKIAIVDIGAFSEGIGELKQRYEKLAAEFVPRRTELESMQTRLASQEKVLSENKNLTPQQARKLSDDYEQLKREFQRKQEDNQALAQKREKEETEAIYAKIDKFLDGYAQRHGITYVIEASAARQSGVIVYASPAMFITEDFIKEYNKAHPVAAAPAAPKK